MWTRRALPIVIHGLIYPIFPIILHIIYIKHMKIISKERLLKYSTPEVEVVALIESEMLTGSNESIGGGDDPDIPWT